MSFEIIIQIILIGIGLSMDAFAVAITSGLVYSDLNKKRSVFIAFLFGFMQALMPLIGYWLIELVTVLVGTAGSETAIDLTRHGVSHIACLLLVIIGSKMIIDAIKSIKEYKNNDKPIESKKFSYKEIFFFSVATSIDALGSGVALHGGSLSTNQTVWLHASIIFIITFVISLGGVFGGRFFQKLFKGKYEITSIIGGIILILLGIYILVSNLING